LGRTGRFGHITGAFLSGVVYPIDPETILPKGADCALDLSIGYIIPDKLPGIVYPIDLFHQIPPWEKFDEYAYKFMRRVGMINENCEVVDSAITAPDGDPKSATFHRP
jgi:hypothetical protein